MRNGDFRSPAGLYRYLLVVKADVMAAFPAGCCLVFFCVKCALSALSALQSAGGVLFSDLPPGCPTVRVFRCPVARLLSRSGPGVQAFGLLRFSPRFSCSASRLPDRPVYFSSSSRPISTPMIEAIINPLVQPLESPRQCSPRILVLKWSSILTRLL